VSASSEIAREVQAQRDAVAQLEAQLAPRRRQEAQALAGLEAQRATMERRQGSVEARLLTTEARRAELARELLPLQKGLGRARRAWVRVVAPTVVSLLLLVALMSLGLTGGRAWWLVLLLTGFGFAVGRKAGRGRE